MRMKKSLLFLLSVPVLIAATGSAFGQASAFTYQGHLTDNGAPANGTYDFQFNLFSTVIGGSPVAPAESVNDLNISKWPFHRFARFRQPSI